MDRRTDGAILICHPKFLRGHNKNTVQLFFNIFLSMEKSSTVLFNTSCIIRKCALKSMATPPSFSAIFQRGHFHDFLFVSLDSIAFPKWFTFKP